MRPTLVLAALFVPVLAWAQPAVREGTLPSLAPLIESVKGAVVNIDVQKRLGPDEQMDFFGFFGGRLPRRGGGGEDGPVSPGTGSGFIVDSKGLVLTNNHVIDRAVSIRVRLDDGRAFDGEVTGRDPLTDVAVVRLKGKVDALPTVKLGDSGQVRVGDWVVAIGNPFGLGHSVSTGIISALDRQLGKGRYDQFLQTDAAINPGNSGGPLFNMKGEVIGINTMIVGPANAGVGFAVPSTLVKALLPQLEKNGAVVRGWLGVGIQDIGPSLAKALGVASPDGALVTSVNDGSPAKVAGLQVDDIITAIDGEKLPTSTALTRAVALKRPDSTSTLTVLRGGKTLELKVKLGTRPDLEHVGAVGEASKRSSEGQLGLAFEEVDPRFAEQAGLPPEGAMIVDVQPASPADRAGLRRGQVVIEVNRKPVRGRDQLAAALKGLKSGGVALLRVATPGGGVSLMGLEAP